MVSKVELFAAIRWDERQLGLSIRALAEKYGVHRRTVRQALESAVPPERKAVERAAPVLDPFRVVIDSMLLADCSAPVKQRHTAKRIWQRLVDEHGARVSYSYVAKHVHRRRPQVEAEEGKRRGVVAGFVPQSHEPGKDAEVDFADVWVMLAGRLTKCFLFTFRLSCSGRAIHRCFASQGQEAFLEGHVIAFEVIGGIPVGEIRYDNLRSAVSRVLFGRNREESQRWQAFRAHYRFTTFYCIPGAEGAHEKGGVEGDGGRFRRRHFVPVPEVESLAELNAMLAAADRVEDARHIEFRTTSVGADFAVEAPLLAPLPTEAFDCALTLWPRVDRYGRIMVRQCRYSVPARLIGSRVRVRVSVLEVFDGSARAATHARLISRGAEHLVLDHYLEVLVAKPGALPGSVPLATARAEGYFTADHEAFWAAARGKHGDAAGTRALIEVLLLHRRMPAAQVIAGIRAAVAAGSASADVVAIEARKHHGAKASAPPGHPDTEPIRRSRAAVVSMPPRPDLPEDVRGDLPSVAAYDQLLHPPASSEGT